MSDFEEYSYASEEFISFTVLAGYVRILIKSRSDN